MSKRAFLVLEDGSVYEGLSFGADDTTFGEVVFNTSMSGYQEMLTDPSYAGQIVVPTYPLIGNYGINPLDSESKQIQVRGFVVREYCPTPSHWQSIRSLHEFLQDSGIPALTGIDTRALTRRLRSSGVMMGILSSRMAPEEAMKELKKLPRYGSVDYVKEVTTDKSYPWELTTAGRSQHHIVILDMGLKYNIARILARFGCSVTIVPCTMPSSDILELKPDGVVLSPGPGDPALLDYLTRTVQELVYKKPVMGICLGHQLIGRAFGAKTFKLKFGHRGGNHPVCDLATNKVNITTQNHGYAVDDGSIKGGLEVSQINLNDNTVEGFRHHELPLLSIQYHSEGSPGPQDNIYLFERWLEMIG
ncbi:MAG TPA: glutamine-hydrolyzing carbamoyl-phosphate synthase small subunit [Dehalococcoidia bacterium]|jgi:carbamoyl-phosphate synthase small subunit